MMWLGAVAAAFLLAVGATPANAGVDDFSYESWDAKYELSLDDNDRAVAKVTETLVPVFPDFDQNRGLIRGLPLRYEGAPAAPENISVTDDDRYRLVRGANAAVSQGRIVGDHCANPHHDRAGL